MMALAACAAAPPPAVTAPNGLAEAAATETETETAKIAAVRAALLGLDASIDPEEAVRAARIAVRAPLGFAQAWNVVDAPLVHNFKVVNGLRDKGVCQDFADALHGALKAERFRTLVIHRALANADNIKLEHATVVLTARGQRMDEGLILDPWRIGQGRLWFGRVTEDPRYDWETIEAVHARRQLRRAGG